MISGLVAYPSNPPDIGQTICRGLEKLHADGMFNGLINWEEIDIPGRFISSEILQHIEKGNLLLADITKLNFNVVFEIGFAIGCKKRTILLKNEIIKSDDELIGQIGIFDTLGYTHYNDSNSFQSIVSNIKDVKPLRFDENNKSMTTPVYLLLPQNKGDIETHLIARIKKARLFFRSYDPEEHGRLSALEAIENVATSHGVIIPLLANNYVDAKVHNIRGAFVAGLAQGMNRIVLLIQSGDDPVPIDYRDLVKRFIFPNQIDDYVSEFATAITESLQSIQPPVDAHPASFLSRLRLGASSAENEFKELGEYYLETDEFRRALRGEVQIVLGRKGSGKTALFFQMRDRLRREKQNVILDLKPEGFQLVKFKELVLDYLTMGTQEHTITAFWEYLLLLEICHKLLEMDKFLYLRDHQILPQYLKLSSLYDSDEYVSEGDFAERMLKLTQRISEDFGIAKETLSSHQKRMTNEEITGLIYKHDIKSLESHLIEYLKYKKGLWILFDNLDKGWPPYGVTPEDVLILRCLIDAMDKLQRSLLKNDVPTYGIVFIRNDVYDNLVAITPDRGKTSHSLIDWTDPELLLELLRRRFVSSGIQPDTSFNNIWLTICASHIRGEETAHYMVDRCLMRPRSLIDFLRFCRSHAVNLGHAKIELEDIEQGEEQYSSQLVNDLCYELQDVLPLAKDILYEFIECPAELSKAMIHSILDKTTSDIHVKEKLIDLLLWHGVIGFRRRVGEPAFIYSVHYDMRRLKALLQKKPDSGLTYCINPAFWKALEIRA